MGVLEIVLSLALLAVALFWVFLVELPADRDRRRRPRRWRDTERRDDGSAARRRW